jgi:spermidine synthase
MIGTSFSFTLIIIGLINPKTIWSPYNRLDLSPEVITNGSEKLQWGYKLTVQHTFYQSAYNLSESFIDKIITTFPDLQVPIEEYIGLYGLPYKLVSTGSKVLIVGSGMGTDVAAALRSGMGQVEAVEIDPSILELGRRYHPEKPYDDPRVTAVVDDARSYLNRNREKYDLVIFAFLDSHSLLSSMSSVRLDSFVYTMESFQQAMHHLSEDGFIVVSFAANEWIEERLGRMLEEVFGSGNVYYHKWADGTTFTAGYTVPSLNSLQQFSLWRSNSEFSNLSLPTDNWPYIYLRSLRIPAGEWQTLLVIGLLCIAMMAHSFPEVLKPNWHFWLLGAAFLLIEFKSITELALLFGTTWFVNSLAISGVLIMALFANLIILKTEYIDLRWIYTCLFISLIFGYFFPLARLAGFNLILKGIIGMIILSLPLFFAGMIFSESLRRYGEISRPLASNFSGSAVGGMLEYGSIWWGIKSLYVIAAILYLGAMIVAIRQRLLSK